MASRSPRVVAVGDGIVDLVTPPMTDFAPGDVQTEVPRFDPLPGGNATNFALQMASLGASTTFIGAVGSDSNARLLRDRYRQYGVRARLCVDPRRPTGSTMALTWSTGRRALVTDPGGKAPSRLRRRGSRDPPRRPGCHRHHVIRHRPESGVRCCDRQPNGVRRRFQRRLHLHETHSAVGQGIASIRERGRSAPPTESSSALSNTPGDPPIPPGIRRSLGRFSLLHISPSGRRSYAIPAWKRMMASTGSPALSPVPAEAWAMLGRTDLEAYTCWDFPTQSAR